MLESRSAFEALRTAQRGNEQALMRLEAQQQARGDAGGRALEAVLGMDGVHGTIASLGRVPPEYMEALNTAAGSRLNNVVVDDDGVASQAIAYLKETRAGRLTFLPLNRLREVPRPPVQGDGVIDYAVNLVRFDPQYERAFGLVFGGTLVLKTLAQARRLLGRHRMATLEGELLEKTGAMTGGFQKRPARGFAASVEDDVRRLLAAIAGQEAEAAELDASVRRFTAESESLRAARARADQEFARCGVLAEEYERRLQAMAVEETELGRTEGELGDEGAASVGERAEIEQALGALQDEIAAANRRVASLRKDLEETEIPALTDQRERARSELEEVERRLRNKESDIADTQRERVYFTRRIEELAAERERLEEKNRQLDTETGGFEAQITAGEEEIRGLEARQQTFSAELEDLRRRRAELQTSILDLERALLELEGRLERVRFQVDLCVERGRTLDEECAALRVRAAGRTTTLTLAEIDEGIAGDRLRAPAPRRGQHARGGGVRPRRDAGHRADGDGRGAEPRTRDAPRTDRALRDAEARGVPDRVHGDQRELLADLRHADERERPARARLRGGPLRGRDDLRGAAPRQGGAPPLVPLGGREVAHDPRVHLLDPAVPAGAVLRLRRGRHVARRFERRADRLDDPDDRGRIPVHHRLPAEADDRQRGPDRRRDRPSRQIHTGHGRAYR